MNFVGKRVLVIAGSTDIGRAAVEMFHEADAHVATHGRDNEIARCSPTVSAAPRIDTVAGQTTTIDGCRSLIESAVATLGGQGVQTTAGRHTW